MKISHFASLKTRLYLLALITALTSVVTADEVILENASNPLILYERLARSELATYGFVR
jgi:hypothetical protein